MPATPIPNTDPRFGHLTAVVQGTRFAQQKIQQLTSGATHGLTPDQWGNCAELYGPNLDQVVAIGGAFKQPAVYVTPGVLPGTAGRVFQANLATGTITLSEGVNQGTLVSTASGAFAVGQVIGAADTNDPSSGTATHSIVPGSAIAAISGTTVDLMPPKIATAVGNTHSSTTIDGIAATDPAWAGSLCFSSGVPILTGGANTVVLSVTAHSITLSEPATATASSVELTFTSTEAGGVGCAAVLRGLRLGTRWLLINRSKRLAARG